MAAPSVTTRTLRGAATLRLAASSVAAYGSYVDGRGQRLFVSRSHGDARVSRPESTTRAGGDR
jgi:hypothetical protein